MLVAIGCTVGLIGFFLLIRLQVSRVPKKTKKGGSSDILIKGMPARKKMGAKCLKSRTPEIGVEKHQAVCNEALSTTFPGFRD